MNSRLLVLLALAALVSAKSLHKRSNAYGDEIVSPSIAPASQSSYGDSAPAEQVAPQVSQPATNVAAPVQASGYRKKRGVQNGYGDELVTPAAPAYGEQSYGDAAPVEQAPAPLAQPAPVNPAPVQASGYRKKRGVQNGYGDELVTPAAPGYGDQSYGQPAPVEQAPAAVSQPVQVAPPAPVQASGYRKKRNTQNGYGDELVKPAAPGYGEQSYGAPVPIEHAPTPVAQPSPAAPAPVQASGYRKKRGAQNGYGDELVMPAAPGYGDQYGQPAPVEQAPPAVSQPVAVAAPAPVQASGYRKRRDVQNGYGDEIVTPAPAQQQEQAYGVQTPVEQAPASVSQPAVSVPVGVQSSGYRKKRGSYGDEPVTPAAVSEQHYEAPVELAPAAVAQPAAVSAPAPVQASGYRKKRNAYGDEPVAPVSNVNEQSYSSQAEHASAQVVQSVPAAQAPIQASGY